MMPTPIVVLAWAVLHGPPADRPAAAFALATLVLEASGQPPPARRRT